MPENTSTQNKIIFLKENRVSWFYREKLFCLQDTKYKPAEQEILQEYE